MDDYVGLRQLEQENRELKEELANAKVQLQDTSSYYEYLLALMPGHVFWQDRDGIILGCNDKQARSFGLSSRKDIVGKTPYDLLKKKEADFLKEVNEKVLSLGEAIISEESGTMVHGERRTYVSQKIPLRHHISNEIIGVLGVSVDITDKKRTEQLAKEKEIAARTITYLKTMASSMSHELRTPISNIRYTLDGTFQEATHSLITIDKADFSKKDIPSIGQRLEEVVTDIMNCMKHADMAIGLMSMQLNNISTGKIDDRYFKTSSMIETVNNALNTFFFENNQKKFINWQNEDEQDFEFWGESLLSQLLIWNLLRNALRAIKESEKGEITIWLEHDNNYNYLHFKDTAKGMPAEVAARVFDQFYTKSKGGTGLGLSFCQTVMHSYGGDITCTAEEGQYAQFTLKFPHQG